MSCQPETRPVLVAVNGTVSDDAAIRYAVAEARRRQCPHIRLVHVAREPTPISPMLPL